MRVNELLDMLGVWSYVQLLAYNELDENDEPVELYKGMAEETPYWLSKLEIVPTAQIEDEWGADCSPIATVKLRSLDKEPAALSIYVIT